MISLAGPFFAADIQPLEAENTKAKTRQRHKTNLLSRFGLNVFSSSFYGRN